MDDMKNLLLAILLSMGVLFLYQIYFAEPPEELSQAEEPAQQTDELSLEGKLPPESEGLPLETEAETPAQTSPQEEVRTAAIDAQRVRGSVSTRAGKINRVILKDYYDSVENDAGNVIVLRPEQGGRGYTGEFGWVGGRETGVAVPDRQTVWQAGNQTLTSNNELELVYDTGQGVVFRQFISIDENFLFTVRQVVENNSGQPLRLAPYGRIRRTGTPDILDFFILHEGPLGVFNQTLEEYDYDDLQEESVEVTSTEGGWLGFTDKYWLTAMMPEQDQTFKALFRHSGRGGVDRYQIDFLASERIVPDGGIGEYTSHFFAGAKEVNLLDKYEEKLGLPLFDRAIDWGWFYFLTKPIFHALDWIAKYVGNVGVAILILTVIIKLILFPLANKSYRSMSRMKKLQPKLQQIKERFGEDKLRLQQETMALYKKEKVNPASGCLPILVQIPVFFALYKVLFVTIEMRHQPFFGWVRDLSAPDQLTIITGFGLFPWDAPGFLMVGVWPILMGLTMWLQQKLNPQSPDPIQAKIFMFMPIIFTFILAPFPVGLVIYWTWNNLLSIAQQWVIMKKEGAFDTK